ncbi:chromosomal replication initiator protein DnaA [Chloracidobacterium validum]|uniref:Chromosomal replication initiator protein DnaA n=1 Tax=Chloracidobacterium validum TaxID=2821543 RepID=A0ABX8BDA6_9BACT|nr:chromosomal replication initiator protein DnaA [Chloracidobacterium validum]QUW04011.1 chromosomal replication initiator protein DnaA [Chloracidobacterium validum]
MDDDKWISFLGEIEKRINHESFSTWFKPATLQACQGDTIYLCVPNRSYEDWITETYHDVVEEALKAVGCGHARLAFVYAESNDTRTSNGLVEGDTLKAHDTTTYGALDPDLPDGLAGARIVDLEPLELPLNPKYTFETFVVGSCNQFARAAAMAVADTPTRTYNPLFIYGGVGLGKTHLMHAIGQSIRSRDRHMRLVYISSEKFMNELINAIRYDKAQAFREKYRSIDVLLIDDIQFIAGKERTQEEFFHTFNALYDAQKQIVISSDCPPREIPTLEERLHSRFEWGLIADLQPPDLETKVAILKRKADIEKIDLSDNVALFIAGKIKSNIRELEGSLIRLVACASFQRRPIDIELCKEVLNIEEEERPITIEMIQRVVSDHYGLRVADLKSKNNSRNIAVPRQVAMYLCKQLTNHSLPEIGRHFGNKHHTTVLHSCEKISRLYQKQSDFHRLINNLISSFK